MRWGRAPPWETAWLEWHKLDGSVGEDFKKKLIERLDNPRVRGAALSGVANCYKIKLQALGLRLVYRVDDGVVFVTVVAIRRRDKKRVFSAAKTRL